MSYQMLQGFGAVATKVEAPPAPATELPPSIAWPSAPPTAEQQPTTVWGGTTTSGGGAVSTGGTSSGGMTSGTRNAIILGVAALGVGGLLFWYAKKQGVI